MMHLVAAVRDGFVNLKRMAIGLPYEEADDDSARFHDRSSPSFSNDDDNED